MGVSSTRMRRLIHAPRDRVYGALVDPTAVARWRVPAGMTSEVHEFEAREGGAVRISLTYDAPDRAGKTSGRTDTYRGRFVRLVPNELVVEADEFESDDPAMRGEMMTTITLSDADGGTELVAVHNRLPEGISPADNELGWREALARLAELVESP
ncbi:MAG: SRPBCC family protein [Solirubrobacteraceae bacterium]